MKCICCDKNLSDFESTRKDNVTGVYLDMCNTCFKESGMSNIIVVDERNDLSFAEDIADDDIVYDQDEEF